MSRFEFYDFQELIWDVELKCFRHGQGTRVLSCNQILGDAGPKQKFLAMDGHRCYATPELILAEHGITFEVGTMVSHMVKGS